VRGRGREGERKCVRYRDRECVWDRGKEREWERERALSVDARKLIKFGPIKLTSERHLVLNILTNFLHEFVKFEFL